MAIDEKFIIRLNQKEYPLYAGILGEAHRRGLLGIETELIQIPKEENENVAIVKAIVTMEVAATQGRIRTFADYGDASPANTSKTIATALIRMASTRAKGRALRDAIDCGSTMLEELPEAEVQRAQKESEPRRSLAAKAPSLIGREPVYESGGKKFRRQDLIGALKADLERARNQGLPVTDALPADLETAPNEALYAAGLALRHQLKTVAALEQPEKEGP